MSPSRSVPTSNHVTLTLFCLILTLQMSQFIPGKSADKQSQQWFVSSSLNELKAVPIWCLYIQHCPDIKFQNCSSASPFHWRQMTSLPKPHPAPIQYRMWLMRIYCMLLTKPATIDKGYSPWVRLTSFSCRLIYGHRWFYPELSHSHSVSWILPLSYHFFNSSNVIDSSWFAPLSHSIQTAPKKLFELFDILLEAGRVRFSLLFGASWVRNDR